MVIAGHKEAVERAGAACKAAGAKRALPLPVSVPSHCALMKPAADKLAVELAKITFNAPTVPVVNNVDVKCETNGDAIRDALVRQLYNPVQWTKSVEYMAAQGVEHLYEVGGQSAYWPDETHCRHPDRLGAERTFSDGSGARALKEENHEF